MENEIMERLKEMSEAINRIEEEMTYQFNDIKREQGMAKMREDQTADLVVVSYEKNLENLKELEKTLMHIKSRVNNMPMQGLV